MHSSEVLGKWGLSGVLVAAILMTQNAHAGLVQTNRTERWVTNLIEVKLQATKLVTEYRTNLTEEVWNNIMDIYVTNRVTKIYTNRIVVDRLQTNLVNAYRTNLQVLNFTNWTTVPLFRTNEITRHLTNRVTIESFRTNFVQAYQTNMKTLRLTNWSTVYVFKTNWVTQPMTNLVSIDLPATHGAPPSAAARAEPPASGIVLNEGLALQARRTTEPSVGKPAEVQLTVHTTKPANASLEVQQWRVERDDGSMLLFGQGPEFRRALPVGKYKVEVRARQPGTNQLLAALGTLSVMTSNVSLQQNAPKSWVSAQ